MEDGDAVGWQAQVLGKLAGCRGRHSPGRRQLCPQEDRAAQPHDLQCVRQDIHRAFSLSPAPEFSPAKSGASINILGVSVIAADYVASHTVTIFAGSIVAWQTRR